MKVEIHHLVWTGGDVTITQENLKGQNTIILCDADIAAIIKARYNLKDFSIDDLVDALRQWEVSRPAGGDSRAS